MQSALTDEIIAILSEAQEMTIATVRSDGYPQATTVSYVHDGLIVYFGCSATSQKAVNLSRNHRVSATINLPHTDWNEIRGLSLGGTAARVRDPTEKDKVRGLILRKFLQVAEYAATGTGEVALFRIMPRVVSILDYRKGFGHTDIVKL
jgi:nitroimidazol reductase NimA-like FMN-containing flavoprotein (pyridoxamine 5'-phosphate oxidase superfamily)